MNNKKYVHKSITLVMTLATIVTFAVAVPVFADNNTSDNQSNQSNNPEVGKMHAFIKGNRPMMKPGVFGTVTAVNGNTITVTGKQGFGANTTATTFTVDATSAKITKAGTSITVSQITVGDTIMAQGTLTGTNLVATTIRDGQIKMMEGKNKGNKNGTLSTTPISSITGNGQPIIAGTISAISGSTLTVTNKSNVTYTVDATNAKVVKGPNAASIGDVAVGDMVIVQGTVNSNNVVASSVIDQTGPVSTSDTGDTTQPHKGFFGSIGSFFSHLFGF